MFDIIVSKLGIQCITIHEFFSIQNSQCTCRRCGRLSCVGECVSLHSSHVVHLCARSLADIFGAHICVYATRTCVGRRIAHSLTHTHTQQLVAMMLRRARDCGIISSRCSRMCAQSPANICVTKRRCVVFCGQMCSAKFIILQCEFLGHFLMHFANESDEAVAQFSCANSTHNTSLVVGMSVCIVEFGFNVVTAANCRTQNRLDETRNLTPATTAGRTK